jgi:hypothetical protein
MILPRRCFEVELEEVVRGECSENPSDPKEGGSCTKNEVPRVLHVCSFP